ncbi:3'-5' exonuclease DinG [Paenibacillus sp. CECT 9249]|uniref:ATP-dependent DNA helicase n=1 Tax=Paenibacillus sp. CECT 9249 TaxID=2845385 RepID=UPI001E608D1D|nr:ATP-dependent DNA helicase [Paenibacillus sp. CECT 9249]CAH0119299.1 3'-5' exonuclease DinG [Paenibacillus sp. CECT 9249]
MDTCKIPVRSLVEYAYRSGDIDSRFRTAGSLTEGTKAHQKIQEQYGEQDRKEVYLSAEIPYGEHLLFVIDGRCDGLLIEGDRIVVDEIKSTSSDIRSIKEDSYPVHWAQANCYAYMYAKEHRAVRMTVQLTYVHIATEETVRYSREAEFAELERFVSGLVARYAPYAEMMQRHERAKIASIAELAFPFESYRKGQRKLAGAVYTAVERGCQLFAKAPTGIGKTISTLFPAVKAIGNGLLNRLFYLTAKTMTRTAAEEAFSLMQTQGLHMHVVTITAKEKICFQEEIRCTKEDCEYADGYYDRINGALLDLLAQETSIGRETIERYARKHRVCPFEFSLDAAYASDAVICDYNYIFDPRVSLKRLFAEQKKQTLLLIDEAHNLVDRARDMFSAHLDKSAFLSIQREFQTDKTPLYYAAKAVNDHFILLRKQSGGAFQTAKEAPSELLALLENFAVAAEGVLMSASAPPNRQLLDLYFAAQDFIRIGKLYEQYKEHYITWLSCTRSEVSLRMYCLNPALLLRQTAKKYRSGVYFSATLAPLSYYMDILGAAPDDYSISVPTPFSQEQLDVRIMPLSTRYRDRGRSIGPLVRLLQDLTSRRPGNYLAFFPSYAYMNEVYEAFAAQGSEGSGVRTLLQQEKMGEEERERYLSSFNAENEYTLIGFAVMGGIFAEGVDLAGDRLNGVVVVGVGLPQIGPERDIVMEYNNETGRNGYDYAYVYPGMNKVLQAGGRLIRSERDRGLLVLVDDRYLQPRYQRLLPEEWRHYRMIGGNA